MCVCVYVYVCEMCVHVYVCVCSRLICKQIKMYLNFRSREKDHFLKTVLKTGVEYGIIPICYR